MWNHRLVIDQTEPSAIVEIREVFYDEQDLPWGHGRAEAYYQPEEDEEEEEASTCIARQLHQMLKATEAPILNYPEDFIGKTPDIENASSTTNITGAKALQERLGLPEARESKLIPGPGCSPECSCAQDADEGWRLNPSCPIHGSSQTSLPHASVEKFATAQKGAEAIVSQVFKPLTMELARDLVGKDLPGMLHHWRRLYHHALSIHDQETAAFLGACIEDLERLHARTYMDINT